MEGMIMNKSPQLKPLSNPELSAFSSQLSLILRSGISALEGISIMLEDASSEEEKTILNALSENLQGNRLIERSIGTDTAFSGLYDTYGPDR